MLECTELGMLQILVLEKSVEFKHYLVWNFNEDGKVHTVTEYADVGGLLSTFNE